MLRISDQFIDNFVYYIIITITTTTTTKTMITIIIKIIIIIIIQIQWHARSMSIQVMSSIKRANTKLHIMQWGIPKDMAKAHEIGTSSIKKCILLGISIRFS